MDFFKFKKFKNKRFILKWKNRLPCFGEKTDKMEFDKHYVYHTAWAARIISKIKPSVHVDISSTLYFSAMISAFIPVKFYDYRPANIAINNLISKQADLVNLQFNDNSIESLSCMHVVEHVGLGRYGDALDPDGDLKAIKELQRVLAVNGNLLFVAPIGKSIIMFNGQRIYSYDQIMNYFSDLKLENFALITDNLNDHRDFIPEATKEDANQQKYGCGCFWFKKIN